MKLNNRSLRRSKIWPMLVIAMFLVGSIGIAGAEDIDDIGVQIAKEQSTDIDGINEVNEQVIADANEVPLELAQLILQNTGTAPIWLKQTEKWKIINVATGRTRDLPLCVPVGYGYGSCVNQKLSPGEKFTKSWNQKDNEGKLVSSGTYIASAKYYKQDPSSRHPTAYIVSIVFTIYSTPRIEEESMRNRIKK